MKTLQFFFADFRKIPFLAGMSNTTNVVGYYNGYRWPVQIQASKFNITLTLKSGEYILDRAGRKINDPYFEVFVKNKQLHREVSEQEVPLITVPEVVAPNAHLPQTNPVRAITQWTRDARGIRQPVLTQPEPVALPTPSLPAAVVASASDSVTPMSMEEARKRGLVRKVRDVPEDYGVNDTTGLPPGNIPKMRYAIDPGVNKPAAPLPKEALTLPKDDPNRQTRSQLVSNLAQGVRVPAPEDGPATPFANTAVPNAPNNAQLVAGTPIVEAQASEVAEPPVEEAGEMPEPNLPAPAPALVAATPANPAPAAVAAAKAPPTAQPPLKPLTPKNQYVCMACQAPHKFRSQLFAHAKAKHPESINAIMAPYPETPPAPPPLR